jgi:hypothetical protein
MTVYEYVDLSASYHGIAVAALMGYFTVLSAYLVVAYSVGAALNRSQVIAITGLFLVMAAFMTLGTVLYFGAAREYRILSGEYLPPVSAAPIALFLLGLGILSGLKFMWDIRHPKTE